MATPNFSIALLRSTCMVTTPMLPESPEGVETIFDAELPSEYAPDIAPALTTDSDGFSARLLRM